VVNKPVGQKLAVGLAFGSSAAVMVLELVSLRLVASAKMMNSSALPGSWTTSRRWGLPSIIDDLETADGFKPPPFYAAHGIVSIIDVIIKGSDDQPYGILEIDNDKQHDYDQYDINFLTGFANVLAEAVSTAARGAALQVTVDLMKPAVANLTQDDMIALAAFLGSLDP